MNHGSWVFFGYVFSWFWMATSEIEVAFGGDEEGHWKTWRDQQKSFLHMFRALHLQVKFLSESLQQLLLPTFHRLTYFKTSQSRFCFLSFSEAETVPPTRHPHPPTMFFRSRKHWGVEENCFIIQGNKLCHNFLTFKVSNSPTFPRNKPKWIQPM